jgi:hypothetical protein
VYWGAALATGISLIIVDAVRDGDAAPNTPCPSLRRAPEGASRSSSSGAHRRMPR